MKKNIQKLFCMASIHDVYNNDFYKQSEPGDINCFKFVGKYPIRHEQTNISPLLKIDIDTLNDLKKKTNWSEEYTDNLNKKYIEIVLNTDKLEKQKNVQDTLLPDLNKLEENERYAKFEEKKEKIFQYDKNEIKKGEEKEEKEEEKEE